MLLRIFGGLVFCYFSCYSTFAAAQVSSTISGKFVNPDRSPIEAVTVLLLSYPDSSLTMAAITDKEGVFELSGLNPGRYIITGTIVGYKKYFSEIVQVSEQTHVNLTPVVLLISPTELNPVIIVKDRPFVEVRPGKVTLNIDNSILSSGSTAFDILRRSPGIQISGNTISLRGQSNVVVSIDNKLIYLDNEELAAFLQNLQSSAIEQLELIANPKATYDAAGSGIINIKLKKGKNLGLNGSLSAGAGYGDDYKTNVAANLNYRSGRFNTYLMYNYGNNNRPELVRINRSSSFQDVLTDFNIANNDNKTLQNNSYKVGLDLNLDKNNVLGVMYSGFYNTLNSDEDNRSLIYNDQSLDSTLKTISLENRQTLNNSVNINYRLAKPRTSLTVDFDYFDYDRRSDENLAFNFLNAGNTLYKSLLFRNQSPAHYEITSGKIDYSFKLKAATLSAGVKSSYVASDNERRFLKLTSTVQELDSTFSNIFHLNENINAAYINYTTKFAGIAWDAGLRAEQTRTKGTHRKEAEPIDRNYFNFFPNVQFTKALNKNHQVLLSYSRRISRPTYESLNPFIYFLDLFTYREGNPLLTPEYSNKYEFSYLFKNEFTSTLRYTYIKNPILNVPEYDAATKTGKNTDRNYTNQKNYSLEFIAPLNFTPSWTGNITAEGFLTDYEYAENPELNASTSYITATLNQNLTLAKTLKAEASLHYESPFKVGIYSMRAIYLLDLGISKSILQKRGTVNLSIADLFNYDRYRYTVLLNNLNSAAFEKIETRIVRLNVTYRFGQSIGKNSSNRKTGNTEERERLQKLKL